VKVCILTLGCKVNQYESAQIAQKYVQDGAEIFYKFIDDADVYIVNTCAVTNYAEKKSRYEVSKIKARTKNKDAEIIVCGCASSRDFNKQHEHFKAVQSKTRAFIKIQDGCDCFCSYCIVPYLRGAPKSRNIDEILIEIKAAARPVVLAGINLANFADLGLLCEKLGELGPEFELSSLEIGGLTDKLFKALVTCEKFIPNFHLPLQSGSDNVLKSMNRNYTACEFKARVEAVRAQFPKARISTDVIVGYPTETEQDFLRTCEFVKSMNFAKVHIFPFSAREGTAAASLKPLQASVITARVKVLEAI